MLKVGPSWLVLLPLIALGGCEGQAECGDGVLAADEACDDGNRFNGDGCSASCEFDDDLRTPGDDRPGYFWCGEAAFGPGVTCPADTLCCLTGEPSCATHEQGCLDPFNVATCDGPEDCGGGERCERASHDRTCRTSGSLVWCHTNADCRHIDALADGICTSDGTCTFGTAESLGAQ